MFHLREGFYFEREGDFVRILVSDTAQADAPVLRELIVPTSEWASVVATTSARGETSATYHQAVDFLERDSDPVITPDETVLIEKGDAPAR